MRRQIISQVARRTHISRRGQLPQVGQLAQQVVYLLLLANDDAVQLVELVFGVGGFYFQLGQALFCIVRGSHAGVFVWSAGGIVSGIGL